MNKVIIIGAGIIGMTTAWLLHRAGSSVTLIEQGYAGRESSWAGGGIISPLYPWRYQDAITRLALWSQKHYPQFFQEIAHISGIDPQYYQSGLIYLDLQQHPDAQGWTQRFGYTLKSLDGSELFAVEPALNPEFSKGWITEEIAQVRNPRLVKSLRAAIATSNIKLQQHTRMTGLIHKNRQILGITSNRGNFYADQVVIAGGAWSAKLLDGYLQVPRIAPVKGQMIIFRAKPNLVRHIILSNGKYLIPRLDGRVLLGSTLEFSGYDKSIDAQTLQELKQAACDLVPELANYPVEKQWAGLRPGAIDGLPYIGEHPQMQNLFINAGHFRNGVVLGYASCELLKNLLLQQPPIVSPEPFQLHPERILSDSRKVQLEGAI